MVGTAPPDVAVCTLTDHRLPERLRRIPRVAYVAPLATANLGIEHLVIGALGLPHVRHLVVCGRDSPVFGQGQSLLALAANGCGPDGRIIGARGYRARLATVRPAAVAWFRAAIRVHDRRGVDDADRIACLVAALPVAAPSRPPPGLAAELAASGARLRRVAAGGRRIPIDPEAGCFVITVDRGSQRIVARHYDADLTSGQETVGRSAQAILLGLVHGGLLRDPAHAGYVGAELAKAETAIRLGLPYRQDHPLRGDPPAGDSLMSTNFDSGASG
jgi:tetrahydromethanopterin S-methyltransferase subunit A